MKKNFNIMEKQQKRRKTLSAIIWKVWLFFTDLHLRNPSVILSLLLSQYVFVPYYLPTLAFVYAPQKKNWTSVILDVYRCTWHNFEQVEYCYWITILIKLSESYFFSVRNFLSLEIRPQTFLNKFLRNKTASSRNRE